MRLLAALSLLLVAPCTASAATVSSERAPTRTVISFTGSPGEANAPDVAVDRGARTVTVSDPGAILIGEAPCTTAAGVVTCPTSRFVELRMILGDGDDTFALDVPADDDVISTVDAGPGDDQVSARSITMLGGEGNDTLSNSRVTGRLVGGLGADILRGRADLQRFTGGPGVDTIQGGENFGQIVSFADATTPVTADLGAQGAMGPVGEQDDVTGADGIIGGPAGDTLTGDAGANDIDGGDGDDVIDGAGGPDELKAGRGSDRLTGGAGADVLRDKGELTPEAVLQGGAGPDELRAPGTGAALLGGAGKDTLRIDGATIRADAGSGDDEIFAPDGEIDPGANIACGTGLDVAQRFERFLVPADCESFGFFHPKATVEIAASARLRGPALTVEVPNLCYDDCGIRTDLILSGRRAGREVVQVRGRENGSATFALSQPQRRAVRKAGNVTLRFVGPQQAIIGGGFATLPVG